MGRRNWLKFFLLCNLFFSSLSSQAIKIGDETINKVHLGELEYISLPRLIKALSGNLWLVEGRVICLLPQDSGKKEMVFTLDSNFVIMGGKIIKITAPVIKHNETILFPVLALREIFPEIEITEERKEVLSVTSSQIKDTTYYFFEISPPFDFSVRQLSPLTYEVIIFASLPTKILPRGIVREIKEEEIEGKTRLVFYFKGSASASTFKKENGLLVKFYPYSFKRERLLIVLDPGHGGKDPGAIGKLGTKEKDLNLDIAKRLAKKLRQLGYRVLLTRETDEFVSLGERVNFANKNKADLFISIHNNASRDNPRAIGFETYFLAEGRTDLERAQALKENEALKIEGVDNSFLNDDLTLILSDLAQTEFLKESEELACAIQDAADAYLGLANRGVKQAGFYVLRGALMPAVLVECGFLSNRREEKLLRQEKMRERIAEAIFRGVKNFLFVYEKKIAQIRE
ncbi:MAG: N-acetylmuramoyl-L-alanine amidase [candidate division WOR-3 bacterium]